MNGWAYRDISPLEAEFVFDRFLCRVVTLVEEFSQGVFGIFYRLGIPVEKILDSTIIMPLDLLQVFLNLRDQLFRHKNTAFDGEGQGDFPKIISCFSNVLLDESRRVWGEEQFSSSQEINIPDIGQHGLWQFFIQLPTCGRQLKQGCFPKHVFSSDHWKELPYALLQVMTFFVSV